MWLSALQAGMSKPLFCAELLPDSQSALLTSHLLLTVHFFSHVCAVQGQTHTAAHMHSLSHTHTHTHTHLSLGLNVFFVLSHNVAWQPSGALPMFTDVDKKCFSTTVHAGKGRFSQTTHTHTHTHCLCPNTYHKKSVPFTVQ